MLPDPNNMEQVPFAEYGVAIFAIGALVFVIRAFLKNAKDKDIVFTTYMKKKDEAFSSVINNHLNDAAKINREMIASNQSLAKSHERLEGAIVKLVDKL